MAGMSSVNHGEGLGWSRLLARHTVFIPTRLLCLALDFSRTEFLRYESFRPGWSVIAGREQFRQWFVQRKCLEIHPARNRFTRRIPAIRRAFGSNRRILRLRRLHLPQRGDFALHAGRFIISGTWSAAL